MNSIFLDALDQDPRMLQRINRLVANRSQESLNGHRPVELYTIRPSQDLGQLAAGILKAKDLAPAALASGTFWLGIAVSAATGMAAIHFLLALLRRASLWPFVIYRVALGILILVLALA